MLPYNKEYELKEGKYPEKMQEIAAGRAFFRAMGYDDVKVGDTVTLDYRAFFPDNSIICVFNLNQCQTVAMQIGGQLDSASGLSLIHI